MAFTDDEKESATVFPEIDGTALEVLDLYGNPVPFERLDGALKLILKPLTPLYVRSVVFVAESQPPALTAVPAAETLPGTEAQVSVTLHNPLKRGLSGMVSLKLPAPFKPIPSVAIALSPKETRCLDFKFSVPPAVSAKQEMEAVFSTDDKDFGVVSRFAALPVRVCLIAQKAPGAIVVDGDLSKWGGEEVFQARIDNPEQVIKGIPYTKMYLMDQHVDWYGVKDLSAKFQVFYDDTSIYMAVRVYDDKVMNLNRSEPAYIYEGDSVELFVDGRKDMGDAKFAGDGVYHIKIAPATGSDQPPFHHVSKPRDKVIEGFSYASKLLPDGYTLEIKLPRSAFPGLSDLKPGDSLGLALHLNDQDDPGSKGGNGVGGSTAKTTMLWGAEKGVSGDPSKFGKVIFK